MFIYRAVICFDFLGVDHFIFLVVDTPVSPYLLLYPFAYRTRHDIDHAHAIFFSRHISQDLSGKNSVNPAGTLISRKKRAISILRSVINSSAINNTDSTISGVVY